VNLFRRAPAFAQQSITRAIARLASAALLSCSSASLPEGVSILPGSAVGAMLNQCSRQAPAAGEGGWQPVASDILQLESRLQAALREQKTWEPVDWSNAPQAWNRQYVGLVREGRRYIYGNFLPRDQQALILDSAADPIIVCDGGAANFGVEYDVEARRFTHFGLNRSIDP
jgi:hypothetical protein